MFYLLQDGCISCVPGLVRGSEADRGVDQGCTPGFFSTYVRFPLGNCRLAIVLDLSRAQKTHQNIRMPQNSISGIPLILGLGARM